LLTKTEDENHGGSICGVPGETCSSGDWRQAYADYLIQYVKFYRSSGLDISYLGSYNEPSYTTSYASMLSNGTQSADFIKLLGRTIEREGVDIKLTCCDDFGWDQQEAAMAGLNAVGEDGKSASDYLSVITGHGYASAPTYPLSTSLKSWQTEWADLSGHYTPYVFYASGDQGEGLTWARRIQVAFTDANVSAFLYWIGAENNLGNSALIALNGDEVIPSKRFWAFASFSKFVRPGARRIDARVTPPDATALTVSAFVNADGKVAVQVINNGTESFDIKMDLSGTVVPYTTNNQFDLQAGSACDKHGNGIYGSVPAYSMVNFVQ
jgi:O-glycosyl hydrolase